MIHLRIPRRRVDIYHFTVANSMKGSFPRTGESGHSVRTDLLQSGALGDSSSGGYPSLKSDKPGAFQGLAPAESKETLQKGNTK